jgi:hypothetical protein
MTRGLTSGETLHKTQATGFKFLKNPDKISLGDLNDSNVLTKIKDRCIS